MKKKKSIKMPVKKVLRQAQDKPKQMKKIEVKMRFDLRRVLLWVLILMLFVPFLISLSELQGVEEEISITQALRDIKGEKVEKIEVMGETIRLDYKTEDFDKITRKETGESFAEILQAAEIDPTSIEYANKNQSIGKVIFEVIFQTILPFGLIALLFLYIMRQARGAQDGLFSFGKSRAKVFSKGRQKVAFKDVGGVNEAKKELEDSKGCFIGRAFWDWKDAFGKSCGR